MKPCGIKVSMPKVSRKSDRGKQDMSVSAFARNVALLVITANPVFTIGPVNSTTCPKVSACLQNVPCNECLAAIVPLGRRIGQVTSLHQIEIDQVEFFTELTQNPLCANDSTPGWLVNDAVQELSPFSTQYVADCTAEVGASIDLCQQIESACLLDTPNCRQCMEPLFEQPHRAAAILQSPFCEAMPVALKVPFFYGDGLAHPCFAAPVCTFTKLVSLVNLCSPPVCFLPPDWLSSFMAKP